MKEKEISEFGKGLCYNLGMFIGHQFQFIENRKLMLRPEVWFNAASDHFYDLEIPENLPESIKERLSNLRDKCLKWGHGFDPKFVAEEKDITWAIEEAKELLRLIDEFHGIKTKKADWT